MKDAKTHLVDEAIARGVPPCPGVDTRAEDYCAWKAEWDKTHPYAPAEGDAFDAGYRFAWKRARGVKASDGPWLLFGAEAQQLIADFESVSVEAKTGSWCQRVLCLLRQISSNAPAGVPVVAAPDPGPHIVPTAPPTFAVAVARRKWESLQRDGFRMQRLHFSRGDGRCGYIDAWGKVIWQTPDDSGVKGTSAAEVMALVGALEAAVFACDGDPMHPEVVKSRDAVRAAYGVAPSQAPSDAWLAEAIKLADQYANGDSHARLTLHLHLATRGVTRLDGSKVE